MQAAAEGQPEISFEAESRLRGDKSREDIRGLALFPHGRFSCMPNEGKDQWVIRKSIASTGIDENSAGLGKVGFAYIQI